MSGRASATPDDELLRCEERLAASLLAADPAAALAGDGWVVTALLVARLRFERLLHGSRVARERFRDDPRAFALEFRRYHAGVAPRAFHPQAEARDYEAWLAQR